MQRSLKKAVKSLEDIRSMFLCAMEALAASIDVKAINRLVIARLRIPDDENF